MKKDGEGKREKQTVSAKKRRFAGGKRPKAITIRGGKNEKRTALKKGRN